ncbi:MAG TPA: peptidoglycan-binding domain-containing protein [Gaiellaceae bacterium]|nr:peptidoglycan-binding domain-containing protein [Gaiellaceae bacterium]
MSDDEFEFEFFPEQPDPPEGEHDEVLWEDEPSGVHRPRRAAPSTRDVVVRRRIVAGAIAALILLIILIVVLTSGGGGGGIGGYRGYLNDVSAVGSDSQQTGAALASDLAGGKSGLTGKLDTLVSQAGDQLTRLQSVEPPASLASEQSQALAALDLRLRGLQGLRDSLAGGSDTSSYAVVVAHVSDLRTSDLIWSSVRSSADTLLQGRGLAGLFPASTFVSDSASMLKSLRTLLGVTSVSTSGPTLSLGSTGQDVVAWQNSLNQWLKVTAPTQTQLTADGNFGAATQTATEQLQTAEGLTPDGIVGASTRQALQRALAGSKSSTTSPPPPPSSSGTTTTGTTLKLGDSGTAVTQWQNQLNQWLKATSPTQTPLTADGSFGAATQTATEQLQTASGLTPSGVVDDATRQALTTALAKTG